jgi:hypothetical protein
MAIVNKVVVLIRMKGIIWIIIILKDNLGKIDYKSELNWLKW